MTDGSAAGGRLEVRLRGALTAAMRDGRRPEVQALRTALAALDNAGAVPAPAHGGPAATSEHLAGTAPGLAAAEVARRALDDAEAVAIVRAEHADLLAGADQLRAAGHDARAEHLTRGAAALAEALSDPDG